MDRMRRLQARIAHNDSAERVRGLGVDVYLGRAKFVSRSAVEVDGRRLEFARAIIATGGRAMVLPVPGLAEAGYLTNETVFSLRELPKRLTVIGAGPIGCELAQTFRRLGSDVTMISHGPKLLPKEDADAAAILDARFRREGIRLELGTKLVRVERDRTVVFDRGTVASDAILVAVGRVPGVDDLGLDAAGVAFGKHGVEVDDHLRTSNRRIFAAGDVASKYQFTHAADALARIALQNALFFGRKRQSALVVPWCTYTDPEIAHVGANGGPRTFTGRSWTARPGALRGSTLTSAAGFWAPPSSRAMPVRRLARSRWR